MRAVVLMFGTLGWHALSEAEHATYAEQHRAFRRAADARAGCRITGGEALSGGGDAMVVRFAGEHQAVTPGPHAEVTDQLGGYYEVEAPEMTDVVELVRHLPASYTIEIRPLLDTP